MKQAIAPERIIRVCPQCWRDLAILRRWQANTKNEKLWDFSSRLLFQAYLDQALNYCPTCKSQFEG